MYVHAYAACVEFYRDTLGLPILFRTPELTCFEFGTAYLMVEPDDEAQDSSRVRRQDTCIRMNVSDVRERADALMEKGVDVDYQEHAWGTVAKFLDPDGNLCAYKDDDTFEAQVGRAD